jgi:hypothetical protein
MFIDRLTDPVANRHQLIGTGDLKAFFPFRSRETQTGTAVIVTIENIS